MPWEFGKGKEISKTPFYHLLHSDLSAMTLQHLLSYLSGRLQIAHDGQQATGGGSLAGDPKINIFQSRYST